MNRKMKFFTQIFSSLSQFWVFLDVAQDILKASHPKYCLYPTLDNQRLKSDVFNFSVSTVVTLSEEVEGIFPSISLQAYLYLSMEGIQYAYVRGLCSQYLLKSEHSHHNISKLTNPSFLAECLSAIYDKVTLSPKLYKLTSYSHHGLSFNHPRYCISIKFRN
jgi:hypothetical protein